MPEMPPVGYSAGRASGGTSRAFSFQKGGKMKGRIPDYSFDLPALIERLGVITEACWDHTEMVETPDATFIREVGGLLDRVLEELREINKGLYGKTAA